MICPPKAPAGSFLLSRSSFIFAAISAALIGGCAPAVNRLTLGGFNWDYETYFPVSPQFYITHYESSASKKYARVEDIPEEFYSAFDCQVDYDPDRLNIRGTVEFDGKKYFLATNGLISDGTTVFGFKNESYFTTVRSRLASLYSERSLEAAEKFWTYSPVVCRLNAVQIRR